MLLRITNRLAPATDLGFLLHKNPANMHSSDLPSGKAHVFYAAATEQECTACLLLEIDPVALVRGAQRPEDYVNDRPYVASSYVTVAMNRVFGTALAGNCQKRPELVDRALPLEITVEVIRSRGGAETLRNLFEPLGYQVEAAPVTLDDRFPEWGESPYFRLTLRAAATVHDALSHLYVLLPVLDDRKHYYVGAAEVDKLLRHGEGWLKTHPYHPLIVSRYLQRHSSLVDDAMLRLFDQEGASIEAAESKTLRGEETEKSLERPMTLHTQRLNLVAARLKALGAKRILDLGCGEGKLLRRLLADRAFDFVSGIDVSHRSLQTAASRLGLDRMPERQRKRIELRQSSLLYRDKQLAGFDAAALVEVIEHMDPARLVALERVVFEFARPRHVIVTTPNRDYNPLFSTLPPGQMRHSDHRFEWTRAEFAQWAETLGARFGYGTRIKPVGPVHDALGAPSQMAIFSLLQQGAE